MTHCRRVPTPAAAEAVVVRRMNFAVPGESGEVPLAMVIVP